MMRNKETKLLVCILIIVTCMAIAATYFISPGATIIVFIVCALFSIIMFIFTLWRYQKMAKLSHYLREISSGNFLLDVRDNDEGELSILKNEIYKVTSLLAEHGDLMEQDKYSLMNAISDISHQLKTPLTSMKMMAELLSDNQLPANKRQEFTYLIRTQLDRIEWLVSSLLALAKIDAGTILFKKEQINVETLLDNTIESLHIPIDIKQIQFNIQNTSNTTVVVDEKWTREAFINIFKNCIEHTQDGGTIQIMTMTNHLFTEINIQDNGPGIAKKDLPYVFKRFYRGENASDDSVGIGLALAYEIIQTQHGDLSVTSSPGNGTTFTIKFYHDSKHK